MREIVADSLEAGLANYAALQEATGRVALPRGIVSIDACPVLTAANAGLVLSGQSTIRSTQTLGGQFERAALTIRCGMDGAAALSIRSAHRPDVMPAGEVGWVFDGSENQGHGTLNKRILPGQPVPKDKPEFIRAFKGVPFTTGKTEFAVAAGHGIQAGEDVWVTDGPFINECVGEFVRIVAATAQTVTIARPLIRTYKQGTFCRGPFPSRMSFSGVTFDGQLGSVIVQQALDLQFSDCTVRAPAWADSDGRFGLIGCGRVELRRCTLPGLGMSSGHDVRIIDCTSPIVKGEQGQVNVTIERGRFGMIDANIGQCTSWTLKEVECDTQIGIYDGWRAENCRCNGVVYVRGYGSRVQNLKAIGSVHVQHDYEGSHADSGKFVLIEGLDAHWLEIGTGTSGVIWNCSCQIVCRDPATKANWTKDGKPL